MVIDKENTSFPNTNKRIKQNEKLILYKLGRQIPISWRIVRVQIIHDRISSFTLLPNYKKCLVNKPKNFRILCT